MGLIGSYATNRLRADGGECEIVREGERARA